MKSKHLTESEKSKAIAELNRALERVANGSMPVPEVKMLEDTQEQSKSVDWFLCG